MIIKSLDPRINRAEIDDTNGYLPQTSGEQGQTFEVFHQKKRGTHHVHVGSVHAPSAELAFLFAKEQYGRRGVCVNMWVTPTSQIFSNEYEDEDIFESTPDKIHRDPESYKVMDKIQAYKQKTHQTI